MESGTLSSVAQAVAAVREPASNSDEGEVRDLDVGVVWEKASALLCCRYSERKYS